MSQMCISLKIVVVWVLVDLWLRILRFFRYRLQFCDFGLVLFRFSTFRHYFIYFLVRPIFLGRFFRIFVIFDFSPRVFFQVFFSIRYNIIISLTMILMMLDWQYVRYFPLKVWRCGIARDFAHWFLYFWTLIRFDLFLFPSLINFTLDFLLFHILSLLPLWDEHFLPLDMVLLVMLVLTFLPSLFLIYLVLDFQPNALFSLLLRLSLLFPFGIASLSLIFVLSQYFHHLRGAFVLARWCDVSRVLDILVKNPLTTLLRRDHVRPSTYCRLSVRKTHRCRHLRPETPSIRLPNAHPRIDFNPIRLDHLYLLHQLPQLLLNFCCLSRNLIGSEDLGKSTRIDVGQGELLFDEALDWRDVVLLQVFQDELLLSALSLQPLGVQGRALVHDSFEHFHIFLIDSH